jgi:UV DNA damage endonuclease
LNSWQDGNQRNHHDFIDPEDLPEFWLKQDVTVEVEAKAKELAVLKLIREVNKNR